MTDREVLDWWDYLATRSFVFGPAREPMLIEEAAMRRQPESPDSLSARLQDRNTIPPTSPA